MNIKPYLDFYQKEKKLSKPQIIKFAACALILNFAYQYLLIDPMAIRLGVGGMDKAFSNSNTITIFSALILAPILEELLVRGYMSGKYIHFWFFFILPIIGALVFMNFWWLMIGIGLVFLIWALLKYKKNPDQTYISSGLFYTTYIFTALFFAILHIENIETDSIFQKVTFCMISLTPGALLFGWIRYQGGLHYSIILHGLYNLITISLNELLYVS